MYPDGGTTVVNKRMSFLSVLILSLTAGFMTLIVCVSGMAIYGLRIVDRKSDGLVGVVRSVAENLPAYREALPPVLADAINDQRRPDYLKNVEIKTKVVKTSDSRWNRAVVEVVNNGDEVISFLSLRLVVTDKEGSPVVERNTWAASPIGIDDDWRGPILPHHTRIFPVGIYGAKDVTDITHEVTELRVWSGDRHEDTKTVSNLAKRHHAETADNDSE